MVTLRFGDALEDVPVGLVPLDEAQARRAAVKLISAYARAHDGRMPSARAVKEIWAMLTAPPRAELSKVEVKKQGLPPEPAASRESPLGKRHPASPWNRQ